MCQGVATPQQYAQDYVQIWDVAAKKQPYIDSEESKVTRLWHPCLGRAVEIDREGDRGAGGDLRHPDQAAAPRLDKAEKADRGACMQGFAPPLDLDPVVGDEDGAERHQPQDEAGFPGARPAEDQNGSAVAGHGAGMEEGSGRSGPCHCATHLIPPRAGIGDDLNPRFSFLQCESNRTSKETSCNSEVTKMRGLSGVKHERPGPIAVRHAIPL